MDYGTSNLMPLGDARHHLGFKRGSSGITDLVAQQMEDLFDAAEAAGIAEVNFQMVLEEALWGQPGETLLHASPSTNRDAITREGLKAKQPQVTQWGDAANGQPAAVFCAKDPDKIDTLWAQVWLGEHDVWEVTLGDLPWRRDTLNPGSFAILADIPPDQVRLLRTLPSTVRESLGRIVSPTPELDRLGAAGATVDDQLAVRVETPADAKPVGNREGARIRTARGRT